MKSISRERGRVGWFPLRAGSSRTLSGVAELSANPEHLRHHGVSREAGGTGAPEHPNGSGAAVLEFHRFPSNRGARVKLSGTRLILQELLVEQQTKNFDAYLTVEIQLLTGFASLLRNKYWNAVLRDWKKDIKYVCCYPAAPAAYSEHVGAFNLFLFIFYI